MLIRKELVTIDIDTLTIDDLYSIKKSILRAKYVYFTTMNDDNYVRNIIKTTKLSK